MKVRRAYWIPRELAQRMDKEVKAKGYTKEGFVALAIEEKLEKEKQK